MTLFLIFILILFIILFYKYKINLAELADIKPDQLVNIKTISLYGDSISWATYLSPTPGEALAKEYSVSNYAIAGMTLQNLIDGHVAPLQPTTIIAPLLTQMVIDTSAVVLCRLGVNDCLQEKSINQFRYNLIALVKAARVHEKTPVLVGLTHFTTPLHILAKDAKLREDRDKFNAMIEEVATIYRVHFIDINSVPYLDTDFFDGLHPTQGYSSRIDDIIISYLKDNVFAK
jgi:hypothetical protein